MTCLQEKSWNNKFSSWRCLASHQIWWNRCWNRSWVLLERVGLDLFSFLVYLRYSIYDVFMYFFKGIGYACPKKQYHWNLAGHWCIGSSKKRRSFPSSKEMEGEESFTVGNPKNFLIFDRLKRDFNLRWWCVKWKWIVCNILKYG